MQQLNSMQIQQVSGGNSEITPFSGYKSSSVYVNTTFSYAQLATIATHLNLDEAQELNNFTQAMTASGIDPNEIMLNFSASYYSSY